MSTTDRLETVPGYSLAERDRRRALADRLMDEEGLDALIVYGDREMAFPAPFAPDTYFTNDRPGAILVIPKGGEPVAHVFIATVVEDHIQAADRGRSGWLRPENIRVGKMGYTLVDTIEDLGLARARFGVIGLDAYPPFYFDGAMPYNTWRTVLEDLPHATFTSVGDRFFELAAVKSDEEIAVLRWSAQVGGRMCRAMLDATGPGVSENEIYAAAMQAAGANLGYSTGLILGSGTDHIGWGAPAWTYRPEPPRVVEDGDVVLGEVFCSLGMLETQHQPTIAVGRVHPDTRRAADAAHASYLAGVRTLAAGRTFGEVVDAMAVPMRQVDGWQVHPLVHSISPFGLIGVGDRMADLPEAQRYGSVVRIPTVGRDTVLRPGMVFALEPNCVLDRHLANVGATVIVGEDRGVELDTTTVEMLHTAGS